MTILETLFKYSVSSFWLNLSCYFCFTNFSIVVTVLLVYNFNSTLCFFVKTSNEPSSSKSKIIDHLIGMGFPEENVIKAIQEYGNNRSFCSFF